MSSSSEKRSQIRWAAIVRLLRLYVHQVVHGLHVWMRWARRASLPRRRYLMHALHGFWMRETDELAAYRRQYLTWPHVRRALRGAAVVTGGAILAVLLYALILVPFTPDTDRVQELRVQQPSIVLSSDDEELTRYRRVNRKWLSRDQVSSHFVDALLATEDHRFFEHEGLDYRRIVGAFWQTLTGDLQGGSTITQQLARNLYPEQIGRQVTLTRKLKETILAFKLEAAYDKELILEAYLNTVPFLYNAFGVEAGARTYFDKSAADLSVLESATLVGMLKGTAYYNPVRHPERARQRRNVVLTMMHRHGMVDSETYSELVTAPVDLDFRPRTVRESTAPYFTEQVRGWLSDWADENGYNIYSDSLVVHTTLDTRFQELAERAVERQTEGLQAVADVEWSQPRLQHLASEPRGYLPRRREVEPFAHFWDRNPELTRRFIRATPHFENGRDAGLAEEHLLDSLRGDDAFMDSLRRVKTRLEAGFVAMNPRSGHVKAWVGGRDFAQGEYDHVARARRQPGSTFKPFVYAAALEEGFSPYTRLRDRQVSIRLASGDVWRPSNADGQTSGRLLTLREGLVHSKNTITAQLIDRVGAHDVADVARRLGVRESPLDEVPSLALGTSPVSLLEMTTAYSTLAAGGVYRKPVLVTRIEDREGRVVYRAETKEEAVLSERTTAGVVDMLRGAVDEGTGRRIRSTFGIQTDVAGKTGTTQHGADGWFMLMHPDLVAGGWIGFNDQRVTFRSSYWGQGAHNALWVVGDFFRAALDDRSLGLEQRPPRTRVVRARERRSRGNVVDRVGRWLGEVLGREDDREERRVTVRSESGMGTRSSDVEAREEEPEEREQQREVRSREHAAPPSPEPRRRTEEPRRRTEEPRGRERREQRGTRRRSAPPRGWQSSPLTPEEQERDEAEKPDRQVRGW